MKRNPIKAAALTIAAVAMCASVTAQAQIIDPLTGSLGVYTTTLVMDQNSGGTASLSFTDSGSGLQENYVGTSTSAEQSLFLAPASSFSTTFAVGDILEVGTTVADSSTTEDFGLAISATATPPAAGANASTRANFDWASISLRPNQSGGGVRQNSSINGTLTTGSFNLSVDPATVTGLYIEWNSPLSFTLGYINSSDALIPDDTLTFEAGSNIGTAIGFYGDLRATGTSIGYLDNLEIVPAPEPSTLALCGLGLAGLLGLKRRNK
jgi:hypothetical protein